MKTHWKMAILGAVVAVAGVGIAMATWPSNTPRAAYPFATRIPGVIASPLWKMSPAALEALLSDDADRLVRTVERLNAAVRFADENKALLSVARPDELRAEDRKRLREIWWSFFEPMLAIDELKSRHDGWYGIDYQNQPGLHARAFGIAYAALCAQVYGGLKLLRALDGKTVVPALFDEALPELGLPSGTFREMRLKLANAHDQSLVTAGGTWFEQYIEPHLRTGTLGPKITALVVSGRTDAKTEAQTLRSITPTATNAIDVVKSLAFARWFPLQTKVAEWAGDTRVAPNGRRLISDAQLATMRASLKPGDIIIERRNWYISNIGLPGFWPHAAMYAGTQDEIRAAFDGDALVKAKFGVFSERLASKHAAVWKELGEKDKGGHSRSVLEAISEGVSTASIEHSCGADYVAVLRPRLPLVEVAVALDRAFSYFGRPYDFNFDFATDDQVVCSELIIKAFEPGGDVAKGITIPFISVAGRRAVPPTEIVRLFAAERKRSDEERHLDFVYFLDGNEKLKAANVADADALAASAERPKWDIAQP